jgi:DNA-binding CsgD family transcriptional regulator
MTSRAATYVVATPSRITGADSPVQAPRKKPASASARRLRPERGWASLAQSEQRVAHLAEGLSNAEIADRLFVSVHTVKPPLLSLTRPGKADRPAVWSMKA